MVARENSIKISWKASRMKSASSQIEKNVWNIQGAMMWRNDAKWMLGSLKLGPVWFSHVAVDYIEM